MLLKRLAHNSLLPDPAVCHSRLPEGPFCKNTDLQQKQEGGRSGQVGTRNHVPWS